MSSFRNGPQLQWPWHVFNTIHSPTPSIARPKRRCCPYVSSSSSDISSRTNWRFPKIGVPPNHPLIDGFSTINHPFWGISILGNEDCPGIFVWFVVSLNLATRWFPPEEHWWFLDCQSESVWKSDILWKKELWWDPKRLWSIYQWTARVALLRREYVYFLRSTPLSVHVCPPPWPPNSYTRPYLPYCYVLLPSP